MASVLPGAAILVDALPDGIHHHHRTPIRSALLHSPVDGILRKPYSLNCPSRALSRLLPLGKRTPRTVSNSGTTVMASSSSVSQEDPRSVDGGLARTSSTKGLCDTVLGVLGGGQLGRMLCQAASPMGIKVAVLDPLPDCPASGISYKHIVGSFRDTTAVRSFAEG